MTTYRQVADRYAEIGDGGGAADAWDALGRLLLQAGEDQEAASVLIQSVDIWQGLDENAKVTRSLSDLARAYIGLEQLDQALGIYRAH